MFGRPSFAKLRATAAFQAELSWWAGASIKSLRARVALDRAWYGTATITSTTAGKSRLVAGASGTRKLSAPTIAFTHVRGLDPAQAVSVGEIAESLHCSQRLARRAALAPLRPHLDRLRAEIDKRLSNQEFQRRAADAWRAKNDAAQSRRIARVTELVRSEVLPELIRAGLDEDEWVSWYQLALVADVHES